MYEHVFERDDAGFFVAYVWPDEWPGVAGVDALLAVLPDGPAVERTAGADYWDNDPDDGVSYLRFVAACPPRELDYRSLFLLLAHHGLALEPTVSAVVFVVNETQPAIFYMYDVRGALVFAPSADRLTPLADAHRHWLTPE